MKKILFSMILAVAAMNINAQLVVDSLGRVGVGTDEPKSVLSVGVNTSSSSASAMASIQSGNKKYGTYVWNTADSENVTYGGFFSITNNSGNAYAAKGQALGKGITDPYGLPYQYTVGVLGAAGFSNSAVGVMGRLYSYLEDPLVFAGVYGSETSGGPSFSNYSGKFAGYFNGKVRVTNGIYATVLSPSASASPSGQGESTILSDRGESVTDKLSQVQAVQFLRYNPTKETNTAKVTLEDFDIDNLSPEELDSLSEAMGEVEPEPYLSPIQYGLDAEQLKAVYPELVYEDDNGNVSINYVEMVPLLVQSINELKAEIAELKGTSAKKAKKPAGTTAIEETVSDVDMVRMDQNKPNPFSESTVITLNIPERTQKASIFIYDMSGKQVQNIAVSERGETNITVYASDLTAGMYIYTLVVDGKVSVTRRMIVTKA